MTTVSDLAKSTPKDDVDRNLALLAYGLLFFAVFAAGVPALIAVAIAYAKRRNVDDFIARHYRFQIFIFWVGLALTLLAALSALTVMGWMLAEVVITALHGGWSGWDTISLAPIRIDATTMVLFGITVALGALTGLWMLATSAYGFVRLASKREIHHTAR